MVNISTVLEDYISALLAGHLNIAESTTEGEFPEVESSIRSLPTSTDNNIQGPIGPPRIPFYFGDEEHLPATLDESKNLVQLALRLEDHGHYKDTYENISQAAKSFETSLGLEHQLTFFCLDKQASLLYSCGQYEEAECLSRKIIKEQINIDGRSSAAALLSCGNLAFAMINQGKYRGSVIWRWMPWSPSAGIIRIHIPHSCPRVLWRKQRWNGKWTILQSSRFVRLYGCQYLFTEKKIPLYLIVCPI